MLIIDIMFGSMRRSGRFEAHLEVDKQRKVVARMDAVRQTVAVLYVRGVRRHEHVAHSQLGFEALVRLGEACELRLQDVVGGYWERVLLRNSTEFHFADQSRSLRVSRFPQSEIFCKCAFEPQRFKLVGKVIF